MINATQLINYIIRPAVESLRFDSGENVRRATMLLAYTCAHESHLGAYVRQINGPALGIMQMEPATHSDIVSNFLSYRPEIAQKVYEHTGINPLDGNDNSPHLVHNMAYAACMARIQYRRSPLPLPSRWDDLGDNWRIYKEAYNSHLGAARIDQFRQAMEIVKTNLPG